MKRWMKISLGLFLAFILLLTAFTYALPALVRHYGGGWLKENGARNLALGDLSLNWLTWTLELREVSISESGSEAQFAGFDRLTVRISPKSIFQQALIVTRFELVGPKVQVIRDGDRFNFSDFTGEPAPPPEPPAEPGKPPLFSLNNLQIVDGDFLYVEQRDGNEVQRHRIRDFDLAVPFIGNTPYLLDQYVTPALHALINGAPLDVGGKLKLFTDAVEVTVDVDLSKVDIPFYLRLLPEPLPLRVASGMLDTRLDLVYRASDDQSPQLQVAGDLDLTALRVDVAEGAELVSLPYVAVRIGPSPVIKRELHLERLHIYNPELWLKRDAEGQWNFARLLAPPAGPAGKTQAATAEPGEGESVPFLATLGELLLKNGRVEFLDEQPKGGFEAEVLDLDLQVKNFSTAAQSRAEYTLALDTAREEKLRITGGLTLDSLAVDANLSLSGVSFEPYAPYLDPYLTSPVAGLLELQGQLSYADGVVRLADGQLGLHRLAAFFGGSEGLKLAQLGVVGVGFDSGGNRLEIGRIELTDGSLVMSRSAEGRLSFLNLLREPPAASEASAPAVPAKGTAPFRYRLGELKGKGLQVTFIDQGPQEPVTHRLGHIALSVKNLAGPEAVAAPFRVQATYGRNGKLNLSGKVTAATGAMTLDSKLQRIALPDFAPYLPENVHVVLADGELDSQLHLSLKPAADGLRGDFSGELGIRNFYCLDSEHREELLRWGSLQLEGIRGELNPFSLHLDGVVLSDYSAGILVDKAGRLNLQGVVTHVEAESEAPPPVEESETGGPGPDISIDTITLQGGKIAFADRHLSPPFASTMYQLGGRIGRISSSSAEPAEVDLRGHLENLSPLQISGRINPLGQSLFADLKVSFKDIELSPATPYTGTYLGYAVEKGKLFLDLEYRIEDQALQAQNRVLLDQFTFGEKVESEQAVNLPVKLAVSLLKDRSGAIRLDIPVAGRTDDPEFSVWSVVLTVLRNLLVKAATSPLSLLQAAFGGGEDFNAVSFPFGTAELLPAEQEKLGKLAEMLKDRPGLRLEVAGLADAERDPESYRRALLQQQLRKEKFLELVAKKRNQPGQTEADVVVAPEELERYLGRVYDRAEFPKPRNFLGLDKSLPAAEMEKLILAHTEAGPEQLAALAQARAAAVARYLTAEQGLPAERLFLLRPDPGRTPKDQEASGNRVEFGVVAR